jgi:soluble lytic murein transglycosylase-like protein
MQLLPSTFNDYQKENKVKAASAFNPAINIDAGAWYLSKINQSFPLEKWEEKVQAYNVGIEGFKKRRRNSNYIERFNLYIV